MPATTRRSWILAATATAVRAQDPWTSLFDGHSLQGWHPSTKNTWQAANGELLGRAGGPLTCTTKHRDFELECEAASPPGCDAALALRDGLDIRINSSHPRELRRTGSLSHLRSNYKPFVADNAWGKVQALVQANRIQVCVDGRLLVSYDAPATLQSSIALQCRDGGPVRFRNLRLRALPAAAQPFPSNEDAHARKILAASARGFPMLDLHVHPKNGLAVDEALRQSYAAGIQYGLAVNCGLAQPVTSDEAARQWIDTVRNGPVFVGMQAEGREWTRMFSRRAVAQFDYVFSDSMTFTDNHGKRMRTWLPQEVGAIADPQEFIETLVDRLLGILDKEPIDLYANPTFLPAVLQNDYETLWTEERRRKVAKAAARNRVAVEINNRYKLPSPPFIKLLKEEGCKFTIGTNNTGAADVGRCEYALAMIDECKLQPADFWIPLAPGAVKAVDRRNGAILG